MKVYTGKGDDGTTGLFYGGRVPKSSDAPEAYGTIDEVVAAFGLARAECPADVDLGGLILRLQRELFVVGAELATDPSNRHKLTPGESAVSAAMAEGLAALIAEYETRLPELTEFVIPGANRLSAALDFARTVVRRAERTCVRLSLAGSLDSPDLLRYLNRLGDLVFLLAREVEPDRTTLHGDTVRPDRPDPEARP